MQAVSRFSEWWKGFLRTQFRHSLILGADLAEFRQTVAQENLHRSMVGALGLWVLNLLGFLVYFPRLRDPSMAQPFSDRIVALYAMNLVFCTLFATAAAFITAGRRRAGRLSRGLTWLFLVWIFWVGLAFTVNGQNHLDHLINYLFALVFAAVVFPLPALPSFLLYAAGYLGLYFWLGAVQHDPNVLDANRGNGFSTCWLAYLVSRVIFAARVTSFTQVKLIERQARELERERSEHRFDRFCLEFRLTRREREILRLVLEGMANQDIARRVFVSHDTVKKHVYHIFRKAGVATRFELARFLESGACGQRPGTERRGEP